MVYDENKRVITASSGMVLTNGKAYSSPGGSVYLGVNSNKDEWHEITEEEYLSTVDNEARS